LAPTFTLPDYDFQHIHQQSLQASKAGTIRISFNGDAAFAFFDKSHE
jgi:hypothetical protein